MAQFFIIIVYVKKQLFIKITYFYSKIKIKLIMKYKNSIAVMIIYINGITKYKHLIEC